MSYSATYFFEYMNTYADIIYAYGASAAIRHVWDHTQTGSCKSVVCETKIVLCDIILWGKKPVQKDTETTLFTTETAQQKQHTTQNYSIYSSVAISAHCCLHWCSHLTSCIGVRTLHLSRHPASALAPCFALPMVAAWPLNCFRGCTTTSIT